MPLEGRPQDLLPRTLRPHTGLDGAQAASTDLKQRAQHFPGLRSQVSAERRWQAGRERSHPLCADDTWRLLLLRDQRAPRPRAAPRAAPGTRQPGQASLPRGHHAPGTAPSTGTGAAVRPDGSTGIFVSARRKQSPDVPCTRLGLSGTKAAGSRRPALPGAEPGTAGAAPLQESPVPSATAEPQRATCQRSPGPAAQRLRDATRRRDSGASTHPPASPPGLTEGSRGRRGAPPARPTAPRGGAAGRSGAAAAGLV